MCTHCSNCSCSLSKPCCWPPLLLQVLFYTRMLSDILGRLLPRKKALAITSPMLLLALSGALLLCSVAFFVYLQASGAVNLCFLVLTNSPMLLLALSGTLLLCSVALLVYLQASDAVVCLCLLVLAGCV
jgi:hypothetical protein